MNKSFAITIATLALIGLTTPANAAPTVSPTSSEGAWASLSTTLDDCLSGSVFVTAFDTKLTGGRTAREHGELAVTVRDNCQSYTDDEGEVHQGVIVFSTGESPTTGAAVSKTLTSGSYSESFVGFDEGGNEQPLSVAVTWSGAGDLVRATTVDGSLRMTTADRPATAQVKITAGSYRIVGDTQRAGLFRNSYNSLG